MKMIIKCLLACILMMNVLDTSFLLVNTQATETIEIESSSQPESTEEPASEEDVSSLPTEDSIDSISNEVTTLAACDLAFSGSYLNEGAPPFNAHSWINRVTSPCGDIVNFTNPTIYSGYVVRTLGDGSRLLDGFNGTGSIELQGLYRIRENAFKDTSFSSVKFGRISPVPISTFFSIGDYAFDNVPLTSIVVDGESYSVPTKTNTIGVGAFSGALVEEFFLPSSVVTATNMFLGNASIRRIYIDSRRSGSPLASTNFGATNLEGVYFKTQSTWMNLTEGSASNTVLVQDSGYETKEISQLIKESVNQFVSNNTNSTIALIGWKKSGDATIYTTDQTFVLGASDAVYYPVYSAVHTITFEPNNGDSQWTQDVIDGNSLTSPTEPTKDGFTFSGWYSDEYLTTSWDFSSPITSGLTLYAKWDVVDSIILEANNIFLDSYTSNYTEQQLLTLAGASATMTSDGSLVVIDIDDQQVADFNAHLTRQYPEGKKFSFTLTASKTVSGTSYETTKTIYLYFAGIGAEVFYRNELGANHAVLFVTGNAIEANNEDELKNMDAEEVFHRSNLRVEEIATGNDITANIYNKRVEFTGISDEILILNDPGTTFDSVGLTQTMRTWFSVNLSDGTDFEPEEYQYIDITTVFETNVLKTFNTSEGLIAYYTIGYSNFISDSIDENENVIDLGIAEWEINKFQFLGIDDVITTSENKAFTNNPDWSGYMNAANLGGIFPIQIVFEVEIDGANVPLVFNPLISIFPDINSIIDSSFVIMTMNYRDFSLPQSELTGFDETLFLQESMLKGIVQIPFAGYVVNTNYPVEINQEDLSSISLVGEEGGIREVRTTMQGSNYDSDSQLVTTTREESIQVLIEGTKYVSSDKGMDGDVLYLKTDTTNFTYTLDELEHITEAELLSQIGVESKLLNTGKIANVHIEGFDEMIAQNSGGTYTLQVVSTAIQNRHSYTVEKEITVTVGETEQLIINSDDFFYFTIQPDSNLNSSNFNADIIKNRVHATANFAVDGSVVEVEVNQEDIDRIIAYSTQFGSSKHVGGVHEIRLAASGTVNGVEYQNEKVIQFFKQGAGLDFFTVQSTGSKYAMIVKPIILDQTVDQNITIDDLISRVNMTVYDLQTGEDISTTVENISFDYMSSDQDSGYLDFLENIAVGVMSYNKNFHFDLIFADGTSIERIGESVTCISQSDSQYYFETSENSYLLEIVGETETTDAILDENGNMPNLHEVFNGQFLGELTIVFYNQLIDNPTTVVGTGDDVVVQKMIDEGNLGGVFPITSTFTWNVDGVTIDKTLSSRYILLSIPLTSTIANGNPISQLYFTVLTTYGFAVQQSEAENFDISLFESQSRIRGMFMVPIQGTLIQDNLPYTVDSNDIELINNVPESGGIFSVSSTVESEHRGYIETVERETVVVVEGNQVVASARGLDFDQLYLKVDINEIEIAAADLATLSENELLNLFGVEAKMINSGTDATITVPDFDMLIATTNGVVDITLDAAVTQNRYNYNVNKSVRVKILAEETQYTVTLRSNDGTSTTETIENIVDGSTVNLTSTFTRSGYALVGWTSTASADIPVTGTTPVGMITQGGAVTVTADTDYYAVWAIDSNGDGTGDYEETIPPTPTPSIPLPDSNQNDGDNTNTTDRICQGDGYPEDYVWDSEKQACINTRIIDNSVLVGLTTKDEKDVEEDIEDDVIENQKSEGNEELTSDNENEDADLWISEKQETSNSYIKWVDLTLLLITCVLSLTLLLSRKRENKNINGTEVAFMRNQIYRYISLILVVMNILLYMIGNNQFSILIISVVNISIVVLGLQWHSVE